MAEQTVEDVRNVEDGTSARGMGTLGNSGRRLLTPRLGNWNPTGGALWPRSVARSAGYEGQVVGRLEHLPSARQRSEQERKDLATSIHRTVLACRGIACMEAVTSHDDRRLDDTPW